jgi:predicted nucleic acid-binding protein
MKDKFFIDTNILVYSFSSDSVKKEISRKIIKDAHLKKGCLSFQVIQEFLNVLTKKFEIPLTLSDTQTYLQNILYPVCEVFPSEELYIKTLEIKERWHFSFYDSLIVASAIEANCKTLYSEDLQHNQKIYELTIINPYV